MTVGILQDWADKRRKAAEQARLEAEKEEKRMRRLDRQWKKDKREFWRAIGNGLDEAFESAGKQLLDAADFDKKLDDISRTPSILDNLSEADLENLRITIQTEIDSYSKTASAAAALIPRGNDAANAMANAFVEEHLHKRRLVLSLITANLQRRTRPQLPVTGVDRRKQISNEVQDLITERNETVQKLNQQNATSDEIKQMENIYNDAIQRKQNELRKLLTP